MIRHKATGMELAWRPTLDRWGDEGTGWALSASDDKHSVVFSYPAETESTIYVNGLCEDSYRPTWRECLGGRDEVLVKAVELGVVEVVDDPPAAVTSADAPPTYVDHCLIEDVRALAIRLFLAGHDDAAAALRRLL